MDEIQDESPPMPKKTRVDLRSRKDRYMLHKVADHEVSKLDKDSIITFYSENDTVRYFMRLTEPLEQRGPIVFYPFKKGRPSYSYMPRYRLSRKIKEIGLVLRRD